MAEQEQSRSEAPSAHKLSRAREKGQVARGLDLSFLSSLTALLLFAWISGAALIGTVSHAMHDALVSSAQLADGRNTTYAMIAEIGKSLEMPMLIFLGTVFIVVLAFELLQTGFIFSSDPLKADFSRLNPASGLKRIISVRMLIETAKNVLKLFIYTLVIWVVMRTTLKSDLASALDAPTLMRAITHSGARLIVAVAGTALFFVVIDQIITRRAFAKQMKMSRREVKQEGRDREGDPRLKQKRKQMHADFVKNSRSMKGLRGADMLIVNPQHVAVALRYSAATMTAPVVVASGTNRLALRLKRLAFLYAIPVIEDRLLARAIIGSTSVGQAIPAGAFQPVASHYNRLRARREAQAS
jgi:flagellar biosynthetic protein FlhB